MHGITEQQLQKDIERIEKDLAFIAMIPMRNPHSLHWYEKRKFRRIYGKGYKLMVELFVDTIALDKRYRKGNWSVTYTVLDLIKKGLKSELSE